MLILEEIADRLRARVMGLVSVDGVAELAAAMQSPQVHQSPRAFIALSAIRGGEVTAVTGAHVQAIEQTLAVYLMFPAHADPTGARAVADVGAIQMQVIEALCGWVPPAGTVTPFRLSRAQLADLKPGLVVQSVEFAVTDQLRIAT